MIFTCTAGNTCAPSRMQLLRSLLPVHTENIFSKCIIRKPFQFAFFADVFSQQILLVCFYPDRSSCHIAVISLFCRLRIPIFYCIDNAGNSGDHRKQNRSAHCLVQDSPKEKTDDSGKAHHDNGYYGSKLFHVAFLLNRLPQYCYSFHFLCCSASVLAVVSV